MVDERHVLLTDFPRFAGAFWTIYGKTGDKPKPFKLNACQRVIAARFDAQRQARKPARGKALKPRQTGISTYGEGDLLHQTITHVGYHAFCIADKRDLPAQWTHRAKRWIGETPNGPEVAGAAGHELTFPTLDSRLFIGSSEGQTPGMGYTLRGLHASEIAKWLHALDILDDLLQAVPDKPGTTVFFESTGEVVGDYWYDSYNASRRGEDEYFAVFLPWFIHEEYVADASAVHDLTDAERELGRIAASWVRDNPQDAGVAGFSGEISPAQIAWRRMKLAAEPFHGDVALFACKYPATEQEAFLSGGRNVFTPDEVSAARATVREPVWRGDVLPGSDPAQYALSGSDGGGLLVWDHNPRTGETPDPKRHYVIGADCQWGSKGDDPDFDAAFVECVETGDVCALAYGRMRMDVWAKTLASLGHYYNEAVLAPERNGAAAQGVILPLLGQAGNNWRYPNLWVRVPLSKYGARKPEDYGWQTDEHSKPELVAYAHERFESSHGFDWADARAVQELERYIVDASRKMTAPEGQHDDLLMARLITSRVARDCFRDLAAAWKPTEAVPDMSDGQRRIWDYVARKHEEDLAAQEAETVGQW